MLIKTPCLVFVCRLFRRVPRQKCCRNCGKTISDGPFPRRHCRRLCSRVPRTTIVCWPNCGTPRFSLIFFLIIWFLSLSLSLSLQMIWNGLIPVMAATIAIKIASSYHESKRALLNHQRIVPSEPREEVRKNRKRIDSWNEVTATRRNAVKM